MSAKVTAAEIQKAADSLGVDVLGYRGPLNGREQILVRLVGSRGKTINNSQALAILGQASTQLDDEVAAAYNVFDLIRRAVEIATA